MFLEEIRLKNFRNIREADLKIKNGLTIFVGENAQGKSNLLESICLLVSGESFRSIQNRKDLINYSSDFSAAIISGLIRTNKDALARMHQTELRICPDTREHRLNKKKVSKAEIVKKFGLVTFNPESLNVIKSGPAERRKMLDEIALALDSSLTRDIQDYLHALRSRNALLREIRDEKMVGVEGPLLLAALTEKYLPLAAKISVSRITAIRQTMPYLERILKHILNEKNVDISVEYVISEQCAIDWTENQVYDAFSKRFKQLRAAEMASGQTLVGPHKHDVVIRVNGRDARYFCSQGQQRAAILAIKIAQIEALRQSFGEPPILVLDDVLSELDSTKQEQLIQLLSDLQSQIFVSTTNIDHVQLFEKQKFTVYEIINGVMKEQDGRSV